MVACSSKKEESVEKDSPEQNAYDSIKPGFGDSDLMYYFNYENVIAEIIEEIGDYDTFDLLNVTSLNNGNYLVTIVANWDSLVFVQLDQFGSIVTQNFFKDVCHDFGCSGEEALPVEVVLTIDRVVFFVFAGSHNPIIIFDRNNGNHIKETADIIINDSGVTYFGESVIVGSNIYTYTRERLCCDTPMSRENSKTNFIKVNANTGEIEWQAIIRAGVSNPDLFTTGGIQLSENGEYIYIYGILYENFKDFEEFDYIEDRMEQDAAYYDNLRSSKLMIAKYSLEGYFLSRVLYEDDDYVYFLTNKDSNGSDLFYTVNYKNTCPEGTGYNDEACYYDLTTTVKIYSADKESISEIITEEFDISKSEDIINYSISFIYGNTLYRFNEKEILSLNLENEEISKTSMPKITKTATYVKYYIEDGNLYLVLIDWKKEHIGLVRVPLQ